MTDTLDTESSIEVVGEVGAGLFAFIGIVTISDVSLSNIAIAVTLLSIAGFMLWFTWERTGTTFDPNRTPMRMAAGAAYTMWVTIFFRAMGQGTFRISQQVIMFTALFVPATIMVWWTTTDKNIRIYP